MKTNKLAYLASRVFETPLLIHPKKLDVILGALSHRLGIAAPHLDFDEDEFDQPQESAGKKPYGMTADGIAIIRVLGTTVRRSTGMDALSGLTSYAAVAAQLDAALADSDCVGIVLDMDSCGGEAGGVFDLSDKVFASRSVKPIYAAANELMYSAAFAVGSAASKVFVTRTSGVGSVGVVALHTDESEADKQDGLKYTYIFAGDKKVLGNSHEPLSDEAKTEIQAEVDRLYGLFVETVARNRGMSADAVRATEAGCFHGPAAISSGFADAMGTLEDAVADLRASLGKPEPEDAGEVDDLDNQPTGDDVPAPNPDGVPEDAFAGVDAAAAFSMHSRSVNALMPGREPRHYSTFAAELSLLAGDGAVGQKLVGCPVPYNKLSCDLGGFRELYEPGCFSESLQRDDIRVLFNHNDDFILGRTSAGTARFFETAAGVQVETNVPNTDLIRDLLIAPIKRKDISGMSAAFVVERARWEQRSGMRIRVIEKARMFESSPATFPAYVDTSASVSSADASHLEAPPDSIPELASELVHKMDGPPAETISAEYESTLNVLRKRLQLIS